MARTPVGGLGKVAAALITIAAALAVAATATARVGAEATSKEEHAYTPVTVAYSSKVDTLNPHISVSYAGTSALHLIGGNLFELRGNGVVPGLAQSSKVSRNGLVWTLTLRRGLRFSDGSPLTSRDVAATFRHFLQDKANAYVALLDPVRSFATPNARTIVIKMRHPYGSFATVLASQQMTIFPAAKLSSKKFFNAPISAGPYKLKSWGGTDTAVFVPNTLYWGPRPLVPQITFKTVADSSSALAQVASGQLSLAVGLPPNLISQIRSPAIAQLTPIYGKEVLTMRGTAAPLNNVNVRRAISKALDRVKISQVVWGGKIKPLAGYWPSTMPAYDPKISTARDLEGAKKLLAGTPCANGCNLSLKYSSAAFPEQGPEALVIKSNLADVGVTVNLTDMDPGSYYNVFGTYDFQLVLYPATTLAKLPEHLTQNELLYDGGQQAAYTGLRVPPIEAAVRQMSISSGPKSLAAAKRINGLFVQYTPFASLTDAALVWATRVPTNQIRVANTTFLDVARQR